jgi:class 3 adenylate cyclase
MARRGYLVDDGWNDGIELFDENGPSRGSTQQTANESLPEVAAAATPERSRPPPAGRFSDVVLRDGALERRPWLMKYRDPAVEDEFVIFGHRSPWPFPFIVSLVIVDTLLYYLATSSDPFTLCIAILYLLLTPAAVLMSETARKYLPASMVVSERTRALFIEHVMMPVHVAGCILTTLASSRHPLYFAYFRDFTWSRFFDFAAEDVGAAPTSGTPLVSHDAGGVPQFIRDHYLEMNVLLTIPIATTPRISTAGPWLALALAGILTALYNATEGLTTEMKIAYTLDIGTRGVVAGILLTAWEWDRRRHFETCVRALRHTRHIALLVDRLRQHVDATRPAGCSRQRYNELQLTVGGTVTRASDLFYAVSDAAVVTVRVVADAMRGDTQEATCCAQWHFTNCLAEACDQVAVSFGATRFTCRSLEVSLVFGLFAAPGKDATIGAFDEFPEHRLEAGETTTECLRACNFVANIARAFRASYRRRFPDDADDPPSLRIGIDTGPIEAVMPSSAARASLTLLVTGRPVRGAETLSGLAMPGSALISGEVRSVVSGHFYSTELHRLRVAGRSTSVSILGLQFVDVEEASVMSGSLSNTHTRSVENSIEASNRVSADPAQPWAFIGANEALEGDPNCIARCSGKFADPDVEREYLAFESNAFIMRHVSTVVCIMECATLAIGYYATGSPMSYIEWILLAGAVSVALAMEAIIFRGNMSQCTQIAIRVATFYIFAPMYMAIAYFHRDFFSIVRIRQPVMGLLLGYGMTGITPSTFPAIIDSLMRLVAIRIFERAFVGLYVDVRSTVVLSVMLVAVDIVMIQALRMRNRSHFADYCASQRVHLAWTQARVEVQERLARLVPARTAKFLADPTVTFDCATSVFFVHNAVMMLMEVDVSAASATASPSVTMTTVNSTSGPLTSSPGGDRMESVNSYRSGVSTEAPCSETLDAALDVLTVLHTVPEVATGDIAVLRYGSAWLLVTNLENQNSSALAKDVLLRATDDVKTAMAASHDGRRISVDTSLLEGPLAGGLIGSTTGRTFVAVGPVIDRARHRANYVSE